MEKDEGARDRDLAEAGPHRAQAQPGQALDKGAPGDAEPADDKTSDETSAPGAAIRPAGRKEMDMPPEGWSKTDEEADESFPASDPPGNY